MPVDVVLGLQWGDEGKGRVIDQLAANYKVVARFQGGANAGHTIYYDRKEHVLHQIPSGVRHAETQNLIGDGVVLDIGALFEEIEALEKLLPGASKRILVSEGCHLVLPLHKALDKYEERLRAKDRIGTTGKGIGPCYQDKYGRRGIVLKDLRNELTLNTKYAYLKKWYASYLNELPKESRKELEREEEAFFSACKKWKHLHIVKGVDVVEEALSRGEEVLAEGAQGALLDIDQGTYPYVTSSHTGIGGVVTGLGVAPQEIRHVWGVTKAYCTRVGEGPFPTELKDEIGKQLWQQGNENGATTGRRRRCGWLDLSALSYAIKRNGITGLIVTKLDVLTGFSKIGLGKREDAKTFTYLEGWTKEANLSMPKEQWPLELHVFLASIEEEMECPVVGVCYGPHPEESFMNMHPVKSIMNFLIHRQEVCKKEEASP